MNNIRIFCEKDVKAISQFQIDMAKQTQNLTLDTDRVYKAVDYLLKHQQHGFFLLSVDSEDNAIGSLLITYENPSYWWIQSVYVAEPHRRKGNFTRIFNQTLRLAKQKNVKRVALYANDENTKAKQTYYKLGMKNTGEYFYGYDLTYGQNKDMQFLKQSQPCSFIIKNIPESSQLFKLPKLFGKIHGNPKLQIVSKQDNKLCGTCQYFTEFSQWRFGITLYINIFFADQKQQKQALKAAMRHLYLNCNLDVGAIRIIVNQQQFKKSKQIWPEMHDEHYQVIAIDIQQ